MLKLHQQDKTDRFYLNAPSRENKVSTVRSLTVTAD